MTMEYSKEDLAKFICAHLGCLPNRTIKDAELCLGTVDGADGYDLIKEIGDRYAVDVSDFPVNDYFWPEGNLNPIHLAKYYWEVWSGRRKNTIGKITIEVIDVYISGKIINNLVDIS